MGFADAINLVLGFLVHRNGCNAVHGVRIVMEEYILARRGVNHKASRPAARLPGVASPEWGG